MFLSVIIPAFNEEKRLSATLKKVRDYLLKQNYDFEVLIVDDGSMDRTTEVINNLLNPKPAFRHEFRNPKQIINSKLNNFRLISYQPNRGKGYAVKIGMLEAKGDWRLLMDADNSTDIAELDKLLSYTSNYNVIIGSRYLNTDSIKEKQSLFRRFVSRGGNLLIRIMLGLKIKDTQCGFKLFSAKAANDIFPLQTIDRWGFDMEILAIALRKDYTIKEVAVDWYNAEGSQMKKGVAVKTLRELWQIKKNIIKGAYNAKIKN